MSFAINPSLSYIDVPEDSIQEIYRSTAAIQLHGSGFRGHNCEAYICICKNDIEVRAYIALLETAMKTIFVYSSDKSGKSPADAPQVTAEAQEYLQKLGFTMERVNLEFSKAMREVIIKGIRVMNPPVKKPQSRHAHQATQTKTVKPEQIRQAEIAIESVPQEEETAENTRLKAELTAARSAIEKITREKIALEASAVKEIALLKAAAIRSTEALQSAEERHNTELQGLIDENNSLRTPHADLEKDELQRAVAEAVTVQAELHEALEGLKQRLADSEAKNRSLEELLAKEATAAKAEFSRVAAENEQLVSSLSAEQSANNTAMEKITSLAFFENSWHESQQREAELCRNLDIMQSHVEELQATVDAHAAASQAAAELQQRVAALEAELQSHKPGTGAHRDEKRMQEHAAVEIQTLTAAKNDVESEYIRLATESREKEEELLEALYSADETILRLQRELEITSNVAAAEQEALRAELKQLIAAGTGSVEIVAAPAALIAPRAAMKPAAVKPAAVNFEPESVSRATPDPVQADAQTAAVAPPETAAAEDVAEEQFDDDLAAPLTRDPALTSGLMNEFGSFCGSSGPSVTEFSLTPAMDHIEYSFPGEVVVLLYSSNSVQAMPDGKKADRCKAFAVVLNKAGNYSVYIAWYMPESKRTVVCSPDHQPVNETDCTAILLDAVAYFEIVGFMMELDDLGANVGSCLKALRKTPVLKRVKNPC